MPAWFPWHSSIRSSLTRYAGRPPILRMTFFSDNREMAKGLPKEFCSLAVKKKTIKSKKETPLPALETGRESGELATPYYTAAVVYYGSVRREHRRL